MNTSQKTLFILFCSLTLALQASTPQIPSNLILKALSETVVSISWKDNSSNESGFKIYRDGKLIYITEPNINHYIDSGLTASTTYQYEVKATNNDAPINNITGIMISEILTSNATTNLDSDFYKFSDWIELYNNTNHSIDISGFYLSDDKDNPKKYKIPSGTTINSHKYLLIWADEKNIKRNNIHTNFKLSSKKGIVTLSDKNGIVLDKIKYKKQTTDISATKIDDTIVYMVPTPKDANTKASTLLVKTKKANLSPEGNFYWTSQTITFTQENGASIYYTTDGSTPTKNSTKYTAPIKLNKTTVLKSIAIEENKLPSEVQTSTYIINHDSDLPVVSLSIDEKYLFDDMVGIYVDGKNGAISYGCYKHRNDEPKDYKNFNQDWERPAYIEYFDENRQKAFEIGADISISGQCSRYSRKKSFSFGLDSKYGDKYLKYPLYEDKPTVDKVKDFKLRTGQGGYEIGDLLAAAFAKDGNFDIDYQSYQTVQMFLNGKYWGIYNFREKKGKNYLFSNYPDIDKKNIDIIAHTFHGDTIKQGDLVDFDKLFNYVKNHDLSYDSNYREVFEMVDENNFIDYMVFMIYSGNQDWIYNNTRMWKEKKDGAKWRWMLDDVDNGFMATDFDTLYHATKTSTFLSVFFKDVLRNSTFKQKFKQRFYHHLDGVFSETNMLTTIDKLIAIKRPYMDLESNIWSINKGLLDSHANRLRDFAKNRRAYIKPIIDNL